MTVDQLKDAACLTVAAKQWFAPSRTGKAIHTSVLARWSDRGILVNGERVYLQTWRQGGQRVTTKAAAETFLAALNPGSVASRQEIESDSIRRGRESGAALEKLGC